VKLSLALRLGRVSNLPTVATNVLTGAALSGAAPGAGALAAWSCAIALFYVAGMYLNDAFDRGWDAQHRPERPIPSGAAAATTVFVAGFGMLAAGLALVASLAFGAGGGGWPGLAGGLGLAALIVLYDLHHKGNPLGPLLMGGCRVLVYVTVALGLGAGFRAEATRAALSLLGYLMGLTYVARQENLRALTQLWPLALLAVPFTLNLPRRLDARSACFALLLLVVLDALYLMFRTARRDIPGAVSRLLAGICVLDALLVATLRPAYVLPCLCAYVLARLLQHFTPAT
jgi:4-hydroxybenzoate polyprenyltransferase